MQRVAEFTPEPIADNSILRGVFFQKGTKINLTADKLAAILEKHDKWLSANSDGCRADLSGANLNRADLRGADLIGACLSGACLNGANLNGACLNGACLNRADLRWANLSGSDLNGACLSGVDLRGSDLNGANLNGEIISKIPLQISGFFWTVMITEGFMTIGCKRFSHDQWERFTNNQIKQLHTDAEQFWTKNKAVLMMLCEMHKRPPGDNPTNGTATEQRQM